MTIDVSALTARQLGELGRLRAVGVEKTRQLGGAMEGLSPPEATQRLCGRHGLVGEFDRIARAVRQVIRLELELVGLIPAVDRDAVETEAIEDDREYLATLDERDPESDETEREDLRDPVDYRRGPLDVVVASVRKTLGVEAPEDDPFAPPPERRKSTSSPSAGVSLKSSSPRPSPVTGEGDSAKRTKVARPQKPTPSPKSALLRGAAAMPTAPAPPTGWRLGNRGPPG